MSLPGYNPDWGTPQYGGELKLSGPSVVMRFQQNSAMSWAPWNVWNYNTLVKKDPWLSDVEGLFPELAESWEVSGDGLQLTFHLVEGVRFHPADSPNGEWSIPLGAGGHGTEMTCNDVKFSVEWYSSPPDDSPSTYRSNARSRFNNIESVDCPDGVEGYTVVVNLSRVRAPTLAYIAYGGMVIQNKEYFEWLWDYDLDLTRSTKLEGHLAQMGTGAFMSEDADPGVFASVIANPDYFKPGLPLLDRMSGWSIPDHTTRFSAFITAKTHHFGGGSSGLAPAQVDQMQKNYADFDLFATFYQLNTVHLNALRPPFDDFRVRLAFHLAVDRNVWRGMKKSGTLDGSLTPAGVITPGFWSNTPEELATWPGFRQPKDDDIAEANRLMDEVYGAGERPGPWECVTRSVSTYIAYCEIAVEQITRHLGVQMNMNVMDGNAADQRRRDCSTIMDADSAFDSPTVDDPSRRLEGTGHHLLGSDRACLYLPIDAAQLDMERRIEEQDAELDVAKRLLMVRALSKEITLEKINFINYGQNVSFYGYRPEVSGGFFAFHEGSNQAWANFERMWFEQ